MPQHNPEDRVRVKNIIVLDAPDEREFTLTRFQKIREKDANGQDVVREISYEKPIRWNFQNGFFFGWGGKYYSINPGQEKTYPRFMAEHLAKHMVDYLVERDHQATRRIDENGIPRYANNILGNEKIRNRYAAQIVVGVESYVDQEEISFDEKLNQEYDGGNFDSKAEELVDKRDTLLGEVDLTERPKETVPERAPVRPTKDPELAKMRDEADAILVEYTDSDTVASITAKIRKEMA